MSVRSLLTTGLLAVGAAASPQWGWGPPPPPGHGEKTVTKTVTKDHYHTVTVTGSCSAASAPTTSFTTSTTGSPSGHSSASPSGSSASTSASTTSGGSSGTTTTTSSASSETNPTTTLLATATATNYGLNDAAKAAGKLWFGTAADIPGTGENQDPYYMAEFNNTHDFGEATPANIMKFMFTEPEQNVFNFTGADEFLAVVQGTNKLVRCHNLIWQSELPTWVTSPNVTWTNETLTAVLRNHVKTLVKYFGDNCYSWDVVNEALSDNPAGAWQSNIWYDTIGSNYVAYAFAAAQEAVEENNLKVKLYYNDYNIEYAGNKSLAAQNNIVKALKSQGIQIDGVGLESHFIAGETPSAAAQQANMEAFTALGVDVAVTELDVRLYLPPNATTEAQQVQDYYNTVAACVAVEGCIGVTVWDFDDTYSWVPGTFPGQGYADLFLQPGGADTPLVKKAAYDGCLQALTGAPENP